MTAGYIWAVIFHRVKAGFLVGAMVALQRISARRDYLARAALVATAAGVAVVSLINIGPEFAAHKSYAQGPLGPYRNTAQDFAQPAASVEGGYERLQSCDGALTDLITLLQPKNKRADVAAACMQLADSVLQSAPTLSLAHLIRAIALRELGQDAQARAALLLSELTGGGNVQYAQRRAAIWADEIRTLSADENAALRRDILRLSATPAGITWLAGQYERNSALRTVLTDTINNLSERQQAEFLAAVRRVSQ